MALPPFYISIVQEAYPFRVLMTFFVLIIISKKLLILQQIYKAIYTEKPPFVDDLIYIDLALDLGLLRMLRLTRQIATVLTHQLTLDSKTYLSMYEIEYVS